MRNTHGVALLACAAMVLTGCQGQSSPSPSASSQPAAGPSSPPEPTGPTVMVYRMNESTSATVMEDDGSGEVSGKIGSDVSPGVQVDGATGYRFPDVDPRTTTVRPGHLVTIPDSTTLDPGEERYSVEIRYRTRSANGANLIQKGQAKSPGGQFKIQVPQGSPQCYYKGSLGKVGASSRARLDDGAWHTLRCTRERTGVSLFVDGVLINEHVGPVGEIDNTFPMTIGGKADCDMVKVQCDYFGGTIDYVKITKG